ncbi:MAG: methylmalonyl-CoA mutase family protein [Candidatus Heimdallarchaeota archaeon]|nr:methylmalonyl-CoA mutase family protein [Candidatus Heimdallarchaeota archaeon]
MQAIKEPDVYQSKHKIRIVTATSLFDGHDVSIGIMRRILQDSGAEVIHLGHNRSVNDIVQTAIQEDAQGICISSYQGGHLEYFKYMKDLLNERDSSHIKIYGGGGGVIIPSEIDELEKYGIDKIFSVDDGRDLGLQGMINLILKNCDFPTSDFHKQTDGAEKDWKSTAGSISEIENTILEGKTYENFIVSTAKIPVIGITGTGGAGKSSLTDELVSRFLLDFPEKTVAIVSIDPSKRKSGGALLADRIRMNSLTHSDKVFMRSLATRRANLATSEAVGATISICKDSGYDLIIVETSGIGQSDTEVIDITDYSVYVMTSEYGAATQLEKIDMIDFADFIVINKFERKASLDALRDVRKQYRRSRKQFDPNEVSDDELPIYGTMASQFNDAGINKLYLDIVKKLHHDFNNFDSQLAKVENLPIGLSNRIYIIPTDRIRYLAEIADAVNDYKSKSNLQSQFARKLWQLKSSKQLLEEAKLAKPSKNNDQPPIITDLPNDLLTILDEQIEWYQNQLHPGNLELIENWESLKSSYQNEKYVYTVRGKEVKVNTSSISLSHLKIPKVALPKFEDWGDILEWQLLENVPGKFPYTAGVYPFKRTFEDPTRMFAGEGPPEQTNKRFHYLAKDQLSARLSTAFDSVTLYGEDPHERPDIYGKIGNSGVSICTVEDIERLYAGFDLCAPSTSVSMTINGPAPIILAFFMNAAIRQQSRKWVVTKNKLSPAEAYVRTGDGRYGFNVQSGEHWIVNNDTPNLRDWKEIRALIPDETYNKIRSETLQKVRGTVQADILKEDQAQNTCIFSTDFALKLMGDVQQSFIDHKIRNYYSVSISGYHIAEAGANPISQTAFTLANGFTYLEYYLSRGMEIDDFAPNFSFFFSNGLDPEYGVIGRVARRIWAIALKNIYGGNSRSQMLKYHIQTSGRSLHAQEIDFNDIRTTLQALLAIYDNTNSLHTNAYDEAITTPTEESVRRAMAIQLIINREFGLTKNENPNQGAFIIGELTELVEESVLAEFKRISERGGVLGAMETQYQRAKIQEESLDYEIQKFTGDLPIIGVNTFLNPNREGNSLEVKELIRSTDEDKTLQITRLKEFQSKNDTECKEALEKLQQVAISYGNIFNELLDTVNYASLGQISSTLYKIGGEYRRNI